MSLNRTRQMIGRSTVIAGLIAASALGAMGIANAAPGPQDVQPTDGNVHGSAWGVGQYGPYLKVVPTIKGRLTTSLDPKGTLAEAEKKAKNKQYAPKKLSSAQQTSMFNQLRCHADAGAASPVLIRKQWDLDTNRADVGYWSTAGRACNPLPSK